MPTETTLPAEKVELLPCPLCGSIDLFLRDIAGWELDCRGCELSLVLADDPSREGLIARWNTRTTAQPTPASATGEHGAPERDEWRYVQNKHTAEVIAGAVILKPHWRGTGDAEEIRAVMRQIVRDHSIARHLHMIDSAEIHAIKGRRREMVFPSGVPTREWLDIDALLEALENNQLANAQLMEDKREAARTASLIPKLLQALQTSADWFHSTHRNVFGPDFETCNHEQCEASRAALHPE